MSWRCCCSVLAIPEFNCNQSNGGAKPRARRRLKTALYNRSVDTRRMCPNCRAFVTTSDKVCPYCQAPIGPRAIDRRNPGEILGGLIPHARFTTMIILLINTALFIAEYVSPQSGLSEAGRSEPAV